MSKIKLKNLIREQVDDENVIHLPDTSMSFSKLKKYLKKLYGISISK